MPDQVAIGFSGFPVPFRARGIHDALADEIHVADTAGAQGLGDARTQVIGAPSLVGKATS